LDVETLPPRALIDGTGAGDRKPETSAASDD